MSMPTPTHQHQTQELQQDDLMYEPEPKSYDPFSNQRRSSLFVDNYESGRYRDDPSNPSDEALTGTSPRDGTQYQPEGLGDQGFAYNDAGRTDGYHYEKREKTVAFAAPVPQSLREYRRELHGELWTRGGGFRTFGRFFFCTLFTAIFFFLSIVGALALWARPPSVSFGTPGLNSSQSITINTSTISVPLELNISVNNPNYFSIDLSQLSVDLTYPTNSTPVGSGSLSSVSIHSHAQTNFTFPFSVTIDYSDSSTATEDLDVLLDIASKCGFLGGTKTELSFDAEIKVDVTVLSVSVPVNVPSYTINFDCPFDESDFESILQEIESGSLR